MFTDEQLLEEDLKTFHGVERKCATIKLPAEVSHLQPGNDTSTISVLIVYVTRLV